MSVPASARRLFPHTPATDLSVERAEPAIVERLLEDGDRADLRWLSSVVPEERFASWLRERGRRQLSDRSRAFWCLLLDLPEPARRGEGDELWPL